MIGPFVHDIDPVFGAIGGFYLWWYGLSYTVGFLGLFAWLRRTRNSHQLSMNQVYSVTVAIAAGVLLGGRMVEVIFYEWEYYGEHLIHIPAIWLGGMSTHGILLGAIIAVLLWCRYHRIGFFHLGDVLAVAAAYIMGVGRIGNFIDGQIIGSVTDVWWAVKFPDTEGFRHPVVLYDGVKNLLLVPLLLAVRRTNPPRGALVAHFVLWYGCLRIFVDCFRDYRTEFLGFPPGQEFNVGMTLGGIVLLMYVHRAGKRTRNTLSPLRAGETPRRDVSGVPCYTKAAFIVLLVLPTIIPSDWTQDVPARYAHRHEGIGYSLRYPPLDPPGVDVISAHADQAK